MTTEKELSPKWQKRFDFFNKYGVRSFGAIYFFVLGLWRKNLVLIGIIIISGVIMYFVEATMQLPEVQIRAIDKVFQFGFAALYSLVANKAYYLHKVKGSRSWNPFEGGL